MKEVVVHADGIDAQQVAPDAGQLLLQRRPRHHAGDVRGPLQVGNRQRTAIDLAVRIQWQRLQPDECGGHHEIRQRLRESVANGIIRDAARHLRYIGDKTSITGLHLVGCDGGLANARHRHQRRFDLAELNAVTADLDLVVDPSVEDEHAIRPPTAQIARAIQPPGRHGMGLIRHKSLRRQFGTVQVASRQAGPANMKLAHDTGRHELSPPVEHVRRRAGDRHTDRNLVSHLTAAYIDPGRNDRCLGGAVGVEQGDARPRHLAPRRDLGRGRRLAADDHNAKIRAGRQAALLHLRHEHVPVRRGEIENGDPPGLALLQEHSRRREHLIVSEHQSSAAGQARKDFLHAGIEIQRRELQHTVHGPQQVAGFGGLRKVDDGAVLHHHAFRLARGTRRVDDGGKIAVCDGDRFERFVRHAGRRICVDIHPGHRA